MTRCIVLEVSMGVGWHRFIVGLLIVSSLGWNDPASAMSRRRKPNPVASPSPSPSSLPGLTPAPDSAAIQRIRSAISYLLAVRVELVPGAQPSALLSQLVSEIPD